MNTSLFTSMALDSSSPNPATGRLSLPFPPVAEPLGGTDHKRARCDFWGSIL